MAESPHRDLLERATIALEHQARAMARQERAFERQEMALEAMMRRWEENDAKAELRSQEAEQRHQNLLERQRRSERSFVEATSEIQLALERNTKRLDDMGDAIRANTRAVLSVLDRLGPGTATT